MAPYVVVGLVAALYPPASQAWGLAPTLYTLLVRSPPAALRP
eukprot:SAG11_NODE_7886_length_1084_cov_2.018274_2_plen_41_part_01